MCTTKNKATTQTFEDKVCQYATIFDGTMKDFSEVEAIFDNLYRKDFVGTHPVMGKNSTRGQGRSLISSA